MGTWGTGLYSDDTACDVRNTYLRHIGDGISGSNATDELISTYGTVLEDPDEAATFWLALADTQWRSGRLEERVKSKALATIDTGADLARWGTDKAALRRRSLILEKLRAQLSSPQPAQKRVRKRFLDHCDWQAGELISYRLLSGRLTLLRVVSIETSEGGSSPVCEVLDWAGAEIPSRKQLAKLPLRKGKDETIPIWIGRLKESDLPKGRVVPLGMTLPPAQDALPCEVVGWNRLDEVLEDRFGLT